MDVDKMKIAIENHDWGNRVSDGDNFYRLIFILEKKGTKNELKQEDIYHLFQSYKNWVVKTSAMVEECQKNDTREDRKAVEYWERMQQDLLEHMHQIVSTSACENPLIVDEIIEIAEKAEKME